MKSLKDEGIIWERLQIPEPHPLQPTPDCHLCKNWNHELAKCELHMEKYLESKYCPNFMYKFKKKNRRRRR